MEASILKLQTLFGDQVSYQIPQFQRPYAWREGDQWFPLWEDVRNLAERHLDSDGQQRVKPHFMGAIVLQHRESNTGEVTKRLVVDGQQRLTTLQLLIKATQLVFRQLDDESRFNRLRALTQNSEDHFGGDPNNETKIRQSNTNDQSDFQQAIRVTVLDDRGNLRPITQSFRYFKGKVEEWLAEADSPEERVQRSDALEEALRESLLIAVIDLEDDEEPHIIFETLNARGEELKQSDLVKNTVMYEAGVVDEADAAERLWGMFEDEWWRESSSEGRLDRIQLDRLLNHWMMATTFQNVAPNRVASEFRVYLGRVPGTPIEHTAAKIRSAGTVYRDALTPGFRDQDPRVSEVLDRLLGDLNTVAIMPLILYLKATRIPEHRYRRCIEILESYLVRRLLYGRITQGLTSFLISMLDRMEQATPHHYDEPMVEFLSSHTQGSLMWPNDRILRSSLVDDRLGGTVRRRKMILVEIERRMRMESMAESLGSTRNLTIEHVMPREWQANWPLPSSAPPEAGERREDRIHSLGNLTLTTDRLNSSLSNGPWDEKRGTLRNHSTLLLNRDLLNIPGDWNEEAIEERGNRLVDKVLDIWKPAQYFSDNPL